MKHTPYGYDIIDGKAVINEEQGEILKQICENYLSGMSLVKAAASAGLTMRHSGVKSMLRNPRYQGDDFYPEILSQETIRKVKDERLRREEERGYKRRKRNRIPTGTVYTLFSAPQISLKYKNPIKQAEYAYSRIRNEVNK